MAAVPEIISAISFSGKVHLTSPRALLYQVKIGHPHQAICRARFRALAFFRSIHRRRSAKNQSPHRRQFPRYMNRHIDRFAELLAIRCSHPLKG